MAVAEKDEGLLAAYRNGDVRAFEQIYARYAQRLLAYLVGMMGNLGVAEEILQQVFVAFVDSAKALPNDANLGAYLFAGARNRAANLVRDERRRARFADNYEILVRRRESPEAVSAEAAREETRSRLNEGLRKLADGEREVVLLRTQGDLTFEEIAETVGIPLGTAATRYRTALQKLREHMGHG